MNWKQLIHETDEWVLGAVAAVAAIAALLIVRRFVLNHYKNKKSSETLIVREVMLELVNRTRYLAALLAGSFAFFQFVTLTAKEDTSVSRIISVVFFFQLGSWGIGAINIWIERVLYLRISKDPSQATSFSLLSYAVRATFFIILVLLALNNLGFNISALVAGLGVGGIAIALAVQSILGDLFASLTIVLDKPFIVGDSLGIDTFTGVVEHIGMKTTLIRSSTGELLIFANSDLLKSRLKNFQRQTKRVVTLRIGVGCDTTRALLEEIPLVMQNIIVQQPNVRFERSHFYQFGPSSLDFETVYTILNPDYGFYMDTHQKVLFHVADEFERLGLKIPYPTNTVIMDARPPLSANPDPVSNGRNIMMPNGIPGGA